MGPRSQYAPSAISRISSLRRSGYPVVVDSCSIPLPKEPDILHLACFGVYDVMFEACNGRNDSEINITGDNITADEFCRWAHDTEPMRELQDSGRPVMAEWRGALEQALYNATGCHQLCQQPIFCQLMYAGYGILTGTEIHRMTTELPSNSMVNSTQRPSDRLSVSSASDNRSNRLNLLWWALVPTALIRLPVALI